MGVYARARARACVCVCVCVCALVGGVHMGRTLSQEPVSLSVSAKGVAGSMLSQVMEKPTTSTNRFQAPTPCGDLCC